MGTKPIERIDLHKDGSVKAKGCIIDGVLTGYWEWFRKDGTKTRSRYFENGEQAGEWTTYDAAGKVVKVTRMKSRR
jgi:antitoxin component YwqK of YwqJK toxin-antitoxin module